MSARALRSGLWAAMFGLGLVLATTAQAHDKAAASGGYYTFQKVVYQNDGGPSRLSGPPGAAGIE